jgi:GNAT superfamily N-acetyltransferase
MSSTPLVIRPATIDDAHAIAFVHVTTWRTTYGDILPQTFLSALSVERRETLWRSFFQSEVQNSFLLVAEVDGQVIAFANFGPSRDDYPAYDCELYAIYMLEQYQHQGIGRELMRAAMRQLAERGFRAMYVWVLEGNPAIRFYEALGGVRFDARPIDIDGTVVTEYAYGYAALNG